jgi:hypothetical protein
VIGLLVFHKEFLVGLQTHSSFKPTPVDINIIKIFSRSDSISDLWIPVALPAKPSTFQYLFVFTYKEYKVILVHIYKDGFEECLDCKARILESLRMVDMPMNTWDIHVPHLLHYVTVNTVNRTLYESTVGPPFTISGEYQGLMDLYVYVYEKVTVRSVHSPSLGSKHVIIRTDKYWIGGLNVRGVVMLTAWNVMISKQQVYSGVFEVYGQQSI